MLLKLLLPFLMFSSLNLWTMDQDSGSSDSPEELLVTIAQKQTPTKGLTVGEVTNFLYNKSKSDDWELGGVCRCVWASFMIVILTLSPIGGALVGVYCQNGQ